MCPYQIVPLWMFHVAWIKRNRLNVREIFLGKANGSGPGTSPYWLEITSGNTLRFLLGNGTSDKTIASGLISDYGWHMVAGTYNGEVQTLYLDGVQVGSKLFWAGSIYSDNYNFGIGRLGSLGSLYFSGAIDDVRVYNRALSANEIKQLYNQGK